MCKRGNAFSLPVLIARVSLIVSHLPYPSVWRVRGLGDRRRTTENGCRRTSLRGIQRQGAEYHPSSVVCPPPSVLGRSGGFSGEPVPDPIPNSAVKLPCADGTKPQGLEE